MEAETSSQLPPGFRFHPTDEELIVYYLRNQFTSKPCAVSIIPEVNIYKFDPWQLPEKAEFGEKEWYFFTPRDRKYPNGIRPNRATVSGYWKATGSDKAIHSGSKYVGIKKSLVFYRGRPPKGIKTDWIMHEYRLSDTKRQGVNMQDKKSMILDDWVLCRIYKKRQTAKAMEDQKMKEETVFQFRKTGDTEKEEQEMMKFPRTHLMEMDYFADPISQLGKFQLGEMPPPPPPPYQLFNTDYAKFQVDETGIFNHMPMFLNSNPTMYEFSDI